MRESIVCLLVLGAVLYAPTLNGQDEFPRRKVLVEENRSEEFQVIAAKIADPGTPLIKDRDLKRSDIYFRLTDRSYVIDKEGRLKKKSALGGTPYVFFTVPEAGYGRSLYGLYSDLGYGAEDILAQRNKNMVALVIRYKSEIAFSKTRDGQGDLKGKRYDKFVYVPTWKNAFSLFSRLAENEDDPDPMNPFPISFGNNKAAREMAEHFPANRRLHIAQLPYPLLRMAGGPDWTYRQMLDTKMSMNSHFRGVGITENTLSPADERKGLPEFIGPNRWLDDVSEFAVIDMGRMEFREVHD